MTTITHTETIGEVKCEEEFTVSEYTVNPGEVSVFPWLSQQSVAWEFFRFTKCEFAVSPLVSVQKDGAIFMAMEYSAGSPPPPDIKTIMGYHKAVNSPVYRKVVMPVDISSAFPAGGFKYIRHNTQPVDRKLYDAGTLMLASKGGAGEVVGLLSVSYTIKFKTPQVVKPLAPVDGIYAMSKTNHQALYAGTEGKTDFKQNLTWPALGQISIKTIDGVERTVLAGGGTSFRLPPGTYQITSDLNLLTNLEADGVDMNELYSVHVGLWDETTETFTHFDDRSESYASHLAEAPSTGDHYVNLVNSAIVFLQEARDIVVRVVGLLSAATLIGEVSVLTGSNLTIQQMASSAGA
jgi:hypothetical protein